MIKTPTVLILGAGASCPFNFPSGQKLVQIICGNIATPEHMATLRSLGFDEKSTEEFRKALLYSGKSSVDAFLEHQREFIPVGKAAIAQALIPFEHQNFLFDLKNKGNNWYEYLLNKLDCPIHEFHKNNLAFLTFNYDRSLEHFLFTAIKNSHELDDQSCALFTKVFPIISSWAIRSPTLARS